MLLHKNKHKRYTMKEIVSHPWFDEVMDNERTPLSNLRSTLNRNIKDEIYSKNHFKYNIFKLIGIIISFYFR